MPIDGFPIFRSFPPTLIAAPRNLLPDSKIELTYKRKLKDLLYVGEIKIGDDVSKEVVIKFTHSYNIDAHQVCFRNACAPILYFAGKVYLFPILWTLNSLLNVAQTSRFQVIVMEYIRDAKQWDQVNDGMYPGQGL